jgi:glycogen debranching enzyme
MAPVAIRPEEHFIWHGPSLFVFDSSGEAGRQNPLSGFWFRETRFLRELSLTLNDDPPWHCAVGRSSQREAMIGLTYPELAERGGGGTGIAGDEIPENDAKVPWRAVEAVLRFTLDFDRLTAGLVLTNRSARAIDLRVAWRLGADYADLLEVDGSVMRPAPSVQTVPGKSGGQLGMLRFDGTSEGESYRTVVEAEGPSSWEVGPEGLRTTIHLSPQDSLALRLSVTARDNEPMPDEAGIDRREDRVALWRRRLTRVSAAADPATVQSINQAMDDLGSMALLEGPEDEWLAPAAGMPFYPALFGRDAITATWQASLLDQGEQLDHALTRLGRLQGSRLDPSRDEEPGRIVHSVRRGPLARLGKNPFDRYYADDASPFMFVIGLAQLYAWTGRKDVLARHWDTALRIHDWAGEYGDRDRDGYIEYLTHAPGGPKNQGWKDSGDGIIDELGRTVEAPIATCEVQGYWFSALQLTAALAAARGRFGDAKAYWRESQQLKERFNRDWWMPEEGFIGLAMDRDKRLIRSITSNPGHCLAAGIVSADHVPPLVGRMFQPDLWSGWGVRTLSSLHPSYNPVGYHLGSVWAVENATIALGLRRYGFDARALDVAGGIFDLARLFGGDRVPEAVGGYPRGEVPHPGAYPRANPIQAWNQSAAVSLLQTMLGLEPVAPLDVLLIDPVLPSWLPELTLENLRVGGATVTLRFWRDQDQKSHGEIVKKRGTLRLIRQPPPESLNTSVTERVSRFVDGLVHA